MKTIIYYFSGTGNNLAIAKRLAAQLDNTDICPISKLQYNKNIPKEYDWVGFTVPSYYSHIPPFVDECMKNLKYTKKQKIFTIVGCGGNRGLAIQDMRKNINNSHKRVRLEYMVILPGNYILSYNAFPMSYQKLTTKLSYKKIQKIASDIKNNRKMKPLKNGIIYKEKYEPRLQEAIARYAEKGSQYEVNDKCTVCGACVKVCPVGNISITDGKIIFGNKCNQCMGCIQWCNNNAIDYQGIAEKRNRYHHLDVKKSEMFIR